MATPDELESDSSGRTSRISSMASRRSAKSQFKNHEEKQAENFRKMLLSMADDIRVVLIKLADRLHNMRTLEHLQRAKRQPSRKKRWKFMRRWPTGSGIGWIKNELEDLCLKYLKPDVYAMLRTRVAKRDEDRQQYIQEVIELVTKALQDHGLPGQVHGRPKHLYGIYQKMKQAVDLVRGGVRSHRLAHRDRYENELLCARGIDSFVVAAGAWPIQGLHRDSEIQSLSIDPYDCGRSQGRARRISDPHG